MPLMGLIAGIRVRVYAFALLGRLQVDSGNITFDRADTESLIDWNALRVCMFNVVRSPSQHAFVQEPGELVLVQELTALEAFSAQDS